MKQIYPDLWQTSPEHPFGPQMSTHAYLLTRGTGNVLFYSSGHSDEYQHILKNDSWGTYVSHQHKRTLKESLELLRRLVPSVVISSASSGRFSFKEVSPDEWQAIVADAIRSLA
jgi:hypothetical protein